MLSVGPFATVVLLCSVLGGGDGWRVGDFLPDSVALGLTNVDAGLFGAVVVFSLLRGEEDFF